MSAKDDLLRARALIKAKRYDEARAILKTIDHPTAQDWLNKINQAVPDSGAQLTVYAEPKEVPQPATRKRRKLPVYGCVLMLLVVLVFGAGIGVGLFLSSKIIYLILASVLLASAVAYGVIIVAVKLGRVRAVRAAFVFGVLMGLLIYGTYRYSLYLDERQFAREQILADDPKAKPEEVEAAIDQILFEETGYSGIVGMVLLDAEAGMTIVPTRSPSSSQLTLSKELTLVYWVIELLIMALVPAIGAATTAKEPFCEDYNRWLRFKTVGRVSHEDLQAFLDLVNRGNLGSAAPMIRKKVKGKSFLLVQAAHCDPAAPNATLKVLRFGGPVFGEALVRDISVLDYEGLVAGSL